jgi:hypothetical protein
MRRTSGVLRSCPLILACDLLLVQSYACCVAPWAGRYNEPVPLLMPQPLDRRVCVNAERMQGWLAGSVVFPATTDHGGDVDLCLDHREGVAASWMMAKPPLLCRIGRHAWKHKWNHEATPYRDCTRCGKCSEWTPSKGGSGLAGFAGVMARPWSNGKR